MGCSDIGSLSQTTYSEIEEEMSSKKRPEERCLADRNNRCLWQMGWGWPEEAYASSRQRACGGKRLASEQLREGVARVGTRKCKSGGWLGKVSEIRSHRTYLGA